LQSHVVVLDFQAVTLLSVVAHFAPKGSPDPTLSRASSGAVADLTIRSERV